MDASLISGLIPAALSGAEFFGLIALSFFTSFITAAFGLGGGTVLLAVMANILPAKILIPVHATVQLGSNVGRAALLIKHADLARLLWFTLGSLLGALLGGQFVVSLPNQVIQLLLGVFIVYLVFKPESKDTQLNQLKTGLLGLSSTFLTMFVGATGPFVMGKMKSVSNEPAELVATFSSMMVVQHGLKIAVFGFLGFAFYDYWAMILAMVATGFIGTLIGKKWLLKTQKSVFNRVLKLVLLMLALRLIYSSISQLL